MASDRDFTNGEYVVLFDPTQPSILLGINAALSETAPVAKNIQSQIYKKRLKVVGKFRALGLEQTTPSFQLDTTTFTDLKEEILVTIAAEFERKGEHKVRQTLKPTDYSTAPQDGSLVSLNNALDFDYDQGLRKLADNIIIEARVHLIRYNGKVDPQGKDLDYCSISDDFRTDTTLNFAAQLFGFIDEVRSFRPRGVQFKSFRKSPGVNGWDCDVTGAASYGVKYHRILNSTTDQYSFENDLGTFKCAVGILQNARGIHLLGLEDALHGFR